MNHLAHGLHVKESGARHRAHLYQPLAQAGVDAVCLTAALARGLAARSRRPAPRPGDPQLLGGRSGCRQHESDDPRAHQMSEEPLGSAIISSWGAGSSRMVSRQFRTVFRQFRMRVPAVPDMVFRQFRTVFRQFLMLSRQLCVPAYVFRQFRTVFRQFRVVFRQFRTVFRQFRTVFRQFRQAMVFRQFRACGVFTSSYFLSSSYLLLLALSFCVYLSCLPVVSCVVVSYYIVSFLLVLLNLSCLSALFSFRSLPA
jgi:hypothetical protein